MPLSVDLTGLDRLIRRFRTLGQRDASELMRSWERIIDEDNRKGVLAGTDKDGLPLARVTYRPVGKAKRLTKAQRQNVKGGRRGVFGGFGLSPAGLNNNLSSSEYRRLDGPPLAPRKGFSRVITNLFTGHGRYQFAPHTWIAFGAWREVVSRKGFHFLKAHFDGEGHLPKRDLRGVRPEGRLKMRRAAIEWMKSEIRKRTP